VLRWPLANWLWLAVGVLVAMYLVAFGLYALIRLPQPTEFVYGESVVLAEVRRINQGQPLYPAPMTVPLTVTAYTPVYYFLVAWLQRLVGDQSYLIGRTVSLLAMLGAAVLAAVSVRVVAGRWSGGLLAGGLFLTQNLTVLLWAPTHRVDALALCFTLGGLALASLNRTRLAAGALVLAVLTKQTYVVAALCVCLDLWPCRRALLEFLGIFCGGLILALGVGQVLSSGWLVWHVVTANANPLDLDYFSAMVGSFVGLNALPVVVAATLLATPALPHERLWRAYFVLSGVQTILTMGKLGASSNYWLELTAASAVMIGILAVRLSREPDLRAPVSATGLAGLLFAGLLTAMPGYAATVTQTWQTATADPPSQLQAAQLVDDEPGPVLTDDPGLAVLAQRPVEFEFIIFTILATQHVWDEQPILDAINAHRFSLVILTEPDDTPQTRLIAARWSTAVGAALQANYAYTSEDDGYYLYRPVAAG
jgi:hypothetical protein